MAELNLTHFSSFVVMPTHTNYMYPMIFGGAFFSEMDLCAAACVSRLLHASECDSAVTHMFSGTFHDAAECGDIIFLNATIVELRTKAIKVKVIAHREKRIEAGKKKMAEAEFVFVSKKDGELHRHGLQLPDDKLLTVFDLEIPYMASQAAVELDNFRLGRASTCPTAAVLISRLEKSIECDSTTVEVPLYQILESLNWPGATNLNTTKELQVYYQKEVLELWSNPKQNVEKLTEFFIMMSKVYGASQGPAPQF